MQVRYIIPYQLYHHQQVLLILLIIIATAYSQMRLSTYCATENHCPHSSNCDSVNHYCECWSSYSPPDRLLNSCLPEIQSRSIYDPRFTFLSTTCKNRINCPPNSYCDPVGACTCVPGFVTLDNRQCSFERWGIVNDEDDRWRRTRLTCRSNVNCPESAECHAGECTCEVGFRAWDGLGEGFFTSCVLNGGNQSKGLSLGMMILMGWLIVKFFFKD